jgi:hypothetical protein
MYFMGGTINSTKPQGDDRPGSRRARAADAPRRRRGRRAAEPAVGLHVYRGLAAVAMAFPL